MLIKPGMEGEYEEYVKKNSEDGYSRCVVDFSEAWAHLMEPRIDAGEVVADIAKAASSEADKKYGITGFMYGCAVQALSHFWQHGDALRTWHNREYIADEAKADEASAKGQTVNPAVLTITT